MNEKNRQHEYQPISLFYRTMLLFSITLVSIFVAEFGVMLFVENVLHSESVWSVASIDALMLFGILVLPIYFLLLRPMMRYVERSARAEAEVTDSNIALRAAMEKRAKAESDLRLFRDLLDHSNDSILVIDSETSCVLDINNTACTNLGYTKDELLDAVDKAS